ncbi:MAG: hypothetical protein JKY50_07310 [Oleispira sp.]|nr:hypothetical protein [Oleispira sp.]MBL4881191.1 hypothetical protein [Oleispira sp.]
MNTTEIKTAITGNNDGLIMAAGYELAIVKDGKIIAAGNDVAEHAFNVAGDQYMDCFSTTIDLRKFRTPQHNYTTPDDVAIPHAGKGATA